MNIEAQFLEAARTAGVPFTSSIIADGKLRRAHIEGDKLGTKNGAYVLHLDGKPSGWFLNFKTGVSGTWTAIGGRVPMTTQMLEQIEAAKIQREIEQQERHKSAAEKALYIWSSAPIAPRDHSYLLRKRINPHGVKLSRDSRLIIPLLNQELGIVNLQFIDSNGEKRFLSGGKKKGCFFLLHGNTNKLLICEGFSTGVSLFEDSGFTTVVAFDAGNLDHVAKAVCGLYPAADIIICGDNDLSGVGQKAARAAALAVGGKYIIPATPGHDWNDAINTGVTV